MAFLYSLLPLLVASQIQFLSPSSGVAPIGERQTIVWSTDCLGGCVNKAGSLGNCTINLVCSPDEYLDFSLDNETEWQTQSVTWPRVALVSKKLIPSDVLASQLTSPMRMVHSIDTVLGLTSDLVPSSACALEMSIEGPTKNTTSEIRFWAGFRVLSPVAQTVWSSGRSHQVRWQAAASRNWAEIALFKGSQPVTLHPTEDSIGSPSKSGLPWCINSGSCWVFVPDVASEVSYDSLSDTDYHFRIRQFYYDDSNYFTPVEQALYIQNNSLQGFSEPFEVAFNLATFYQDTSIVIYSVLLIVLVFALLVGVGYVRNKQRKKLVQQVVVLRARCQNQEANKVQADLYNSLLVDVIVNYFLYVIEELVRFEKMRKQWTIRCLITVIPLLKTTFDLCYDVWQYVHRYPHAIFIVDIVLQIVAHVANVLYERARLKEMKDIQVQQDHLASRAGQLVDLLAQMLGGNNVAKLRNIGTKGRLRIISITCEQINGVVGVFLAAHMNLVWTDWSTNNALLQIKLLMQILSFNWSFIMLVRGLVRPMKKNMQLIRTAEQITRFGGLFVIQRNVLLGVIYAGIWHNPTLSIFGTNATLTLVIIYMLVSPLAEMMYFTSSLIDYVFEDIQAKCVISKGHSSDLIEIEQLSRNTDQTRINKKIGFFSLSVISQAIFLVILNVTNTFDYTDEARYVRIGVTIYVCISNISKVIHLIFSVLFCRCCGWGSTNFHKDVNHLHHACCCFWTAGLWAPCWVGACCRFCCLTPCPTGRNDDIEMHA